MAGTAGSIEKPSSQVPEVKLAERSAPAESNSNKQSGGAEAAGGGNEGGMGAARSKDHMRKEFGGEVSKLESSELKGAEREYFGEQVLPIQQPTSDPTLTCSGLDAGIEIEDFIKDDNETDGVKGSENVSRPAEHAKDTGTVTVQKSVIVEVTERVEVITEKKTVLEEGAAGSVEQPNVEAGDAHDEATKKSTSSEQVRKNVDVVQAVPITTTAGENEEVIVGPIPKTVESKREDDKEKESVTEAGNKEQETAAGPGSGSTDKGTAKAASNSCVVNMASVDDELKTGNKTKESRKATTNSSNGSVRSKKNKEGVSDQQVANSSPSSSKPNEPKKRGRKPGKRSEKAPDKEASGEAKHTQATVDLTTQPFSDAQQVQLRAQILVYGAIIQGSLPDESLMGAAFTDISKVRSLESFESHYGAAKSIWEKTWKATSERILRTTGHVPKVIGFGGAPIPPVLRPPPSLNSSSTITSVNLPPPSARSSKGKGTKNATGTSSASEFPSMSPLAYSMMSMASATVASWNSARARAPALDPWQLASRSRFSFPQTGIFPATTSTPAALHGPWGTSQLSAPVIGPWGVLSQASFSTGSQLPFGAASQASAGVTSIFPSLNPSVSFSASFLPPVIVGSSGLVASAETEKHGEGQATEPKTKRRRKDQGSDIENSPLAAAANQLALVQREAPDVSPATAGILKDRPASNDTERIRSQEDLEKITTAEDFVHRLETAKQRAEDAASAAASVVQQSQSAWEQIKEKRRTNNMSIKDAQLASCVAAITAAASVAKAAAAAANVAYAAALEAKAMANEAAAASSKVNDTDPTVTHVMQDDERTGNANNNCRLPSSCKSIITGAKEASKEQVRAASAACRRAENLDAVVRAAELAAEAATQAGAVMSIGDPASLAGEANEKRAKEGKTKASGGKKNARAKASVHEKKGEETQDKLEEQSVEIAEDRKETADNITEDDARGDQRGISSDTAKAAAQGDVVDLDAEPSEGMVEDKQQYRPADITEGSHVEIVPDEDGLQGVWFSAKILSIKGDEAFVVYDDLLADTGNGQLEEWVNLTSQIDNIPRVRIAHPMTKDGGMRKRRRAAMGSQTWMKDDHVDVWMRDGWWEGIVQSLDEEENLVTVFFPGDGDTELTKSWNLRPSLVWQDGAWVPWRETQAHKKPKVEGGLSPSTSHSQKPQQETPETPTGKRKKPSETTQKTAETPKPRAKPTKRRKFSDVIEKDQEARATQDASSKDDKKSLQSAEKNKKKTDDPKGKSKENTSAKKQTSPKSKMASKESKTPTSGNKKAKGTQEKQKKKSSSSDVTTDAAEKDHSKDGEVRKSSRMIHPTSKLLEGLESTPKPAKKNGPASSGT